MMVSGIYAAALIGWREAIADIYREVRASHGRDPRAAWERFRERRDDLYKHHPCSALTPEQRVQFTGFPYHDYDPAMSVEGDVDYTVKETTVLVPVSEGELPCRRIASARFTLAGRDRSLDIYWLDIYGGGLWVPVGDRSNGATSYGGGRYLYDTTKGANLGIAAKGDRIRLDFNFLYPPSCALNPAWVCPLSPAGNRLDVAIEAGEMEVGPSRRTRREAIAANVLAAVDADA